MPASVSFRLHPQWADWVQLIRSYACVPDPVLADPTLARGAWWLLCFRGWLQVREFKFLARSTDFYVVGADDLAEGPVVFCRRAEDLFQALRGAVWHEEADHCPTWSAGCRCDVEQA